MSKTLHRSRIRRWVFSVIEAYDRILYNNLIKLKFSSAHPRFNLPGKQEADKRRFNLASGAIFDWSQS